MGVMSEIDIDLQTVTEKFEDIEDIVAGLPIRPGQKRVIFKMIQDLTEEIEGALELASADYE